MMAQLRAVIDLRLAGYRAGGIARYALELYRALERRPDVMVRAIRASGDPEAGDEDLRFRTPPHHRLEQYALGVELALARYRPDVFHATDFIAPRLPRIATVATVHDLAFLRFPQHLTPDSLRYYQKLKQSKTWTDHWITPSQWTADDLVRSFDIPANRVSVVPHGVPPDLVHMATPPRSERERFILAVGTLEPRKRIDLLLDALALMSLPPRLVLVGNPGWNTSALEQRIKGAAGVEWRRNVTDDELRQLYRTTFVVAIPSQEEGFGFVALEAMAAGTPVISSGHGALPEVTGLAALTPESDSPEDWARAIERMMDDEPLWNELSAFGRRRAESFSWPVAAELTVAAYQQARRR